MRFIYKKIVLTAYLLSFFLPAVYAQSSTIRVGIASITPSINTGQNYSPWMNDNLNDIVQDVWSPLNLQYIDVKLTLASRTNVSRLSLYDWQGIFTSTPVTIYALNGTQKTLLGTFMGDLYLQWVDIAIPTPVTADAIIIHKYGNCIPQKVQVFGQANTIALPVLPKAVISFPALMTKTIGDAPFDLPATSTNVTTAITYTSSNPAIASVSNATGRWQVTVNTAGTTTINAYQTGNSAYLAAASVAQPLIVQTAAFLTKIPIDPQRWYQLTNSPDKIQMLFDGITDVNVTNGWGRVINTYDSYYPLLPGETFSIENIKMFDGWGSNADVPTTLSVITDTWQRIPIATFTGLQYGWVGPYPNQPSTYKLDTPVRNARYLVITSSWAYPTEMELYGSYTLPTSVPAVSGATLAAQKQIKLRQCLGVNGFEWNLEDPNQPWDVDPTRLAAVKNFTGIRHYLDWEKLESTQGSYTFNPSLSGSWNYDAMYERLKQEGIEVLACIKTLPNWMLATYPAAERDDENVPVRYGQDFTAPVSYLEQAKLVFQFAARYGNNSAVNRTLLSVSTAPPRWTNDPVNQVKVGLNLIKYIECDNERDKWWKGRRAYQTAREYAANLSAFYDGHKNTMGPGVGVKNADPTMQVVMGGLAAPSPDYVKGMVDWCRQNRGYRPDGSVNLCWDIINYHQYSSNIDASGNSTRGMAPEVSHAVPTAKAFVQMAHQYAGDMPVWITEAGYDLNQGSPLKAIAIGSRSVLETQADWTLRSALTYARCGIERVFMYQLYDDNAASPVQFGSMGLVNGDATPRLAAQYLSQANKLIGNYAYQETLSADPVVDRYELNGQSAYVLVVPDEQGRTAQYSLNLGNATYANVYRPTAGSQTMTVQQVALQNGRLLIQVTETPVFVMAVASTIKTLTTCTATGTILREEWSNLNGRAITDIPLQNAPTSTSQLTMLESTIDSGNLYGARIRGYICPPQTGTYTFWISGDDTAQLWLSTNDDPANKVLIANVDSWTYPREWNKYPSQQSTTINLIAGQRYYIEAIHKEEWGHDQVSVAWRLPDNAIEGPIPGKRLSPFVTTAARSTTAPVSGNTARTDLNTLDTEVKEDVELTAFPNPFDNECYIQIKLVRVSPVILTVYDIQGRLVQKIYSGNIEANEYQKFVLTAGKLPPGVYNIQLKTNTEVVHKRLVLVK